MPNSLHQVSWEQQKQDLAENIVSEETNTFLSKAAGKLNKKVKFKISKKSPLSIADHMSSLTKIGYLAIASLVITFLVVLYYDMMRVPNMKRKFLKGNCLVKHHSVDTHLIYRKKELGDVSAILQSDPGDKAYYLITGEHGSGKSTLVQHACRNMADSAILYISVPKEIRMFGRKLGETVGFFFDEDINLFKTVIQNVLRLYFNPGEIIKSDSGDVNLSRLLPFLDQVAEELRIELGHAPTLIIDDVDLLAQDAPKVLHLLQDKAKEWADMDIMQLVFVCSSGLAPHYLQSRASKSRMAVPLEIGDLSQTQAVQYLSDRLSHLGRYKEKDLYHAVQNVLGGRLNDLVEAVRLIKKGNSIEDSLLKIENKAAETFGTLKIKKIGIIDLIWQKIELILNTTSIYNTENGKISVDDFTFGGLEDHFQDLLRSGVFTYHPETRYISLSSKAMESYLRGRIERKHHQLDISSMKLRNQLG